MFVFLLLALSQEENESGRFLREQGAVDKTKAGKMMISVGKALSYTAQQRWVLTTFRIVVYSKYCNWQRNKLSDCIVIYYHYL